MWSACDCVANSGSSRLRCRGYSATAEASKPRSLSTSETRTLKVPKSTPATTAIPFLRQKTDRQIANNKSKTLALSSWIILHAINQAKNYQNQKRRCAPNYRTMKPPRVFFVHHLGNRINQPFQLVIRLRLGQERHEHGNHHAGDAGPQRLIHILREPLCPRRKREHTHPV